MLHTVSLQREKGLQLAASEAAAAGRSARLDQRGACARDAALGAGEPDHAPGAGRERARAAHDGGAPGRRAAPRVPEPRRAHL